MEDISPRQKCRHCGEITTAWLWRLYEPFPAPVYEILCVDCCQRQDATFTPELAIYEATSRVLIWQGLAIARARKAGAR